ncbi:type VI secretion system baseplate subunit TssG [Thioclava sp. GXIMD4215]|uniref:type VI secretion system baseplate subunit TssG n=1 Tax=Thioclava sp. GXIMD4215 TaxID=3131928 RepID=UPI00311B40B0
MSAETAPVLDPTRSAVSQASTVLARREGEMARAVGRGLLAALRRIEREAPAGRPRIGRNTRLKQSLVRLGQDPFLSFPAQDLARMGERGQVPSVRAQFLGFFGAFGALPLNWTEEVLRWFESGDGSFAAFTDIFAARFQELFFRVWSDARAITQFDHRDDRFTAFLQAFTGTATPDSYPDQALPATSRAYLAPFAIGRVKSPVKLRQMLSVHFGAGLRVEVEEMVPTWLRIEPEARSALGLQCAGLGRNLHLGAQVRSIGEKITIHLHVPDMVQFNHMLPGAQGHAELRDLVRWYLGVVTEVDVALWLPKPQIMPAVLGQSTRIGWMACIAPDPGRPEQQVHATRYTLSLPDGDQTPPRPQGIAA